MTTPHKHAEIIKAWADGAEIEFYSGYHSEWKPIGENPMWSERLVFRIKPEPKPDKVYYGVFDETHVLVGNMTIDSCFTRLEDQGDQIKITFDGETGKLKSAEVL
jgi:hypothetical protein